MFKTLLIYNFQCYMYTEKRQFEQLLVVPHLVLFGIWLGGVLSVRLTAYQFHGLYPNIIVIQTIICCSLALIFERKRIVSAGKKRLSLHCEIRREQLSIIH